MTATVSHDPTSAAPAAATTETITVGDAAICNAESETPQEGPPSRGFGWSILHSAITDSERWGRWIDRAGGYVTPPSVLVDRPASVPELSRYAHHGAWTPRLDGPVRTAGVVWWRLVGLPTTVACRFGEWIAQRPGRAIPVALLAKLLACTTWGGWAVEHLLSPFTRAAAWVLL